MKIFTLILILTIALIKPDDYLGKIHFINQDHSDGILIESDGHFGLVDASRPYKYAKHEVVHVVIDESKGEKNQWKENPDKCVQAAIDYSTLIGVKQLDFVIATHAHPDHIGGIPAIAYYFVNENTTFYYREYKGSKDDKDKKSWAIKAYFKAAKESMLKKKAKMFEVTNKTINFMFGHMNISLLNTEEIPDMKEYGENKASIVQLIQVGETKVFMAGDMYAGDSINLLDKIGKIDVLKLAHHGTSGTKYEFLQKARPNYIVVTSTGVGSNAAPVVAFSQQILKTPCYFVGDAPVASKQLQNASVNLFLYGDHYRFENNVDKKFDKSGWIKWYEYKIYLVKGKIQFKWQKLEWPKGTDWFYFGEENGLMLTGWHNLDWSGGHDTFYFDPTDGFNLRDTCKVIDGKKCCFDKNGVYKRNYLSFVE